MARTALTITELAGPFATDLDDLTFEAADTANQNKFTFTGDEIILAWNKDASPHNVTLTSVADPQNRTGHISTRSVPANTIAAFQATEIEGWQQSDGAFYLEADNAQVFFAILRLK